MQRYHLVLVLGCCVGAVLDEQRVKSRDLEGCPIDHPLLVWVALGAMLNKIHNATESSRTCPGPSCLGRAR
jgi:hypothetical protein